MTAEAAKSSLESGDSELDFEETELKLAPPGWSSRGGGTSAEGERKRGFSEAVEPGLGGSSSNAWTAHGVELSVRSEESKPSGAAKPAAK